MYINLQHNNNLYILKNSHTNIVMKNNYSYNIADTYTKIICIFSDIKSYDTITVNSDDNHIPLQFNCNWALPSMQEENIKKDTVRKNILLPPIKNIDLISNSVDLNYINCLCHDNTNISRLPELYININEEIFFVNQWTGYNQNWHAITKYKDKILYSCLYIFTTRAILLCSLSSTLDNENLNHFDDFDFMSICSFEDVTYDELNRIDCSSIKFQFNTYTILQNPISKQITNICIKNQ